MTSLSLTITSVLNLFNTWMAPQTLQMDKSLGRKSPQCAFLWNVGISSHMLNSNLVFYNPVEILNILSVHLSLRDHYLFGFSQLGVSKCFWWDNALSQLAFFPSGTQDPQEMTAFIYLIFKPIFK